MRKRTFFTIGIAMLVVLWFSCKKKSNSTDKENSLDYIGILETQLLATSIFEKEFNQNPNITPTVAFMNCILELKNRQISVGLYDSFSVEINPGTDKYFVITNSMLDETGMSFYRGGQKSAAMLRAGGENKVLVQNLKVLHFNPSDDDLRSAFGVVNIEPIIRKAGGEVILKKNEECTFNELQNFKNYGLVILNTHGEKHSFKIGNEFRAFRYYLDSQSENIIYRGDKLSMGKEIKKEMIQKYGSEYAEAMDNGDLILNLKFVMVLKNGVWIFNRKETYESNSVYVSSNYIKNKLRLNNTIVFGNMCFSGQSNDNALMSNGYYAIRDAFLMAGSPSYYCYVENGNKSNYVSNNFSISMELNLVTRLFKDKDTTGVAHLKSDGSLYNWGNMKWMHFGKTNYWFGCSGGNFTDPRDGNSYATACINGKEWFAENLRYNVSGSVLYEDNSANESTYGRLYLWSQATGGKASNTNPSGVQGACPQGWHIPSLAEWEELSDILGGDAVAGDAMKSKNLWAPPFSNATNSSGLDIRPAGGRAANYSAGLGTSTSLWTSTTTDLSGLPFYNMINLSNSSSELTYGGMITQTDIRYYSCRCKKD